MTERTKADRTGWSDQRLRQTRAYLRNVIGEGRRDVYDAEEHRLILLDVEAEIHRRSLLARACPCSPDHPVRPGYRYCPDCLSIARSLPGFREEDYRQ